ncbi:uncharacterized protein LOC120343220 [Styela clava]
MEGFKSLLPPFLPKKKNKNVLITRKMPDGTMRIDHDALRQMLIRPEIGDRPVAIISIAGCMRTGKSFILNFIIRYLKAEGWKNKDWIGDDSTSTNGPRWSSGKNRVTVGISIWNKVFYVPQPNNGSEMAVLIMDTQGLFDHKTSKEVNTALLTLSTLASSVQIFNVKERINTQHLDYLKTCVEFAMATAKLEEPFFKLQVLNFLVRDTLDEYEDQRAFGMESGQNDINEILESEEGGKEQVRIRQEIKNSFTKVNCFCLPHPGKLATTIRFSGRNDELEDVFRKWVKKYVESIVSPQHLQPKMAKGNNKMSARDILNMIVACDGAFSGGEYEASNLKEANIRAYYSTEYEKALLYYDETMKNALKEKCYVEKEDLEGRHNNAKRLAKERYASAKEMGDGKCEQNFEKHLETMCDDHFETIKTKNEFIKRKIELEKAQLEAKAVAEYQDLIQQAVILWGMDDPNALYHFHCQYLVQIQQKYGAKANMENIRMEASKYFDDILAHNQERTRAESMIKETRRRDLYKLKVALINKSEKKWLEKTAKYQTPDEMKLHAENIRKEAQEEYLDKGSTNVEKKYLNLLKVKINLVFQNARGAAVVGQKNNWGKRMAAELTTRAPKSQFPLPNQERPYAQVVDRIVIGYITELQSALDKGSIAADMDGRRRSDEEMKIKRFYEDSGYVLQYLDDLELDLAERKRKAEERNKDKWVLVQKEIENMVADIVIKEEKNLEKIMIDRYIDSTELAEHYARTHKNVNDDMSSRRVRFLMPSYFLEEFNKVAVMKLKESYEEMKKLNEKHENNRISNTDKVPEVKKSLWARIKEKFASLFSA